MEDNHVDYDVENRNNEIDNFFKKNMRRVFWLFFAIFIFLGGYFVKLVVFDAKEIKVNPANTRMYGVDTGIKRGSITDEAGEILAESTLNENGKYTRTYPYGETLSHFIGYSVLGKSGIEGRYNFELEKINFEVIQRVQNLATGKEIEANDLVVTADIGLSETIYTALGNQKGAVVVLEPSTGKILSMASYPNFNPSTISEHWETVKNDEGSPLLNRGVQGLYAPGSTFKIVTSLAALNNIEDINELEYECKGEAVFGEKRIRCYNSTVHGTVNLESAFAKSCNTYFAYLGTIMPTAVMRETASELFIDKDYDMDFLHSVGSFTLEDGATDSLIVETAIGQGKTLVTPMNMAMIASAVANGGMLMEPYGVESQITPDGTEKNKKFPSSLGNIMSGENADAIKKLMIECVQSGTGTPAASSNVVVAGKTGTAETDSGESHSWFIGFAPADDPKIAFAVLLENAGGGGKSLKIGKEIVDFYY